MHLQRKLALVVSGLPNSCNYCVWGGGGGEGWREPPQLPGNGEGSMGKAWELKLEEAVYVIHNEGILAAYFLYLDVTGMFAC